MKSKTVKIPIYGGRLLIYFTDNLQSLNGKYNLGNVEGFEALSLDDGGRRYVIAFNDDPKASVIAHEAVHITNMIFKDVHVKLDINNDEPYAYLLEWVVEQVDKFKNKI